MSSLPTNKSVLIVGGGAFGSSTAYHLTQRGYKSVRVLDRWPVPSVEAAGNDINKVIRADYPEPLYSKLATEAMAVWKDQSGILKGFFNSSGWLIGAGDLTLPFCEASIQNAENFGHEKGEWISAEEVKSRWPAFTGDFPNWKIFWNGAAGWVNARGALVKLAGEAMKAGAEYISGDAGYVKQLLFDAGGTCLGARCADGTAHFADLVVLAAGASTAGLLDMKGQLVAKGYTVGHIRLSSEEIEKYRNIPVIDHLENGIIFPPNENNIIKLGAVRAFTNYNNGQIPRVSLPRYRSDNLEDGVPKDFEMHVKNWLKEMIPELADREWTETRICWDADTADLHFIVDRHPSHPNLNLAVGGSVHGFKFFPIIGKYIVELLDGTLDPEIAKCWKWRPGVIGRTPGPIFHPIPTIDLENIEGWK